MVEGVWVRRGGEVLGVLFSSHTTIFHVVMEIKVVIVMVHLHAAPGHPVHFAFMHIHRWYGRPTTATSDHSVTRNGGVEIVGPREELRGIRGHETRFPDCCPRSVPPKDQ